MTITVDPEENEIDTLLNFVDLDGRRVLEIGSGDGRLTWSYAAWLNHTESPSDKLVSRTNRAMTFSARDS